MRASAGKVDWTMRRKSKWSSTLVRERISVHALAAVRTVRVKIVGEEGESREAAVAAAKRGFAKTQSFLGVLPRFDDSLPSLSDLNALSGEHAKKPVEEAPSPPLTLQEPAERRERAADAPRNEPDRSTTLRVKAIKPGRAQQLWRRQTPLFAFFIAASLCVLSVLAVNLLAP